MNYVNHHYCLKDVRARRRETGTSVPCPPRHSSPDLSVLVQVYAPARRVVVNLVRRSHYLAPSTGMEGAGPEPEPWLDGSRQGVHAHDPLLFPPKTGFPKNEGSRVK